MSSPAGNRAIASQTTTTTTNERKRERDRESPRWSLQYWTNERTKDSNRFDSTFYSLIRLTDISLNRSEPTNIDICFYILIKRKEKNKRKRNTEVHQNKHFLPKFNNIFIFELANLRHEYRAKKKRTIFFKKPNQSGGSIFLLHLGMRLIYFNLLHL